MYDQEVFDQMAHHDSHFEEFVRPAAAAATGYYIGHKLSQTRMGQRFEHSSTVGYLLTLFLTVLGGYAVYCIGTFIYFLLAG